ncbi:MAG: signal recognition particle-docking protein FtsY [Cellvibrionales bacterium]
MSDTSEESEASTSPPKKSFLDRFRSAPPATPAPSLAARMRGALSRSGEGLADLFLGAKVIDDALLEELEAALLMADVGVATSEKIIRQLTEALDRRELADVDAARAVLEDILIDILRVCEQPLAFEGLPKPAVILMVGVNGVGKTTTIGKLCGLLKARGLSTVLAAGDTFRAAAVEQLQSWGQRHAVTVVAQHAGADSASVIYDALQSAQAKGIDVVIADTAGRLHNKSNLMEELAKIIRVMAKLDPSAPHEVLLVLDAATGQNALAQMKEFLAVAGVTGIVLTKLDGTAKGGVIFALADQYGLPVRYIGVGEGVDDLQPFVARDFVQALLSNASGGSIGR